MDLQTTVTLAVGVATLIVALIILTIKLIELGCK
ncbi:hypothetical protein GGR40_000062 [Novosphingobium gossypii]